MGSHQAEPMDSIILYEIGPLPDNRDVEPPEHDPEITFRPEDTVMDEGDSRRLTVNYRAFKGPVKVELRIKFKDKIRQKTLKSLHRIGAFSFDLNDAKTAHTGTYIVTILDEGRSRRHGANPVQTSWKITVNEGSGSWCPLW